MCSELIEQHVHIDRNINDDRTDFNYLFRQINSLRDVHGRKIYFHFNGCGFLRQNAVSLLGALVRALQQNENIVYFDMSSMADQVAMNLKQNGFLNELGLGGPRWDGNSIPYREDKVILSDNYTIYLSQHWLGRDWVRISDKLKIFIIDSVIEAYINVFDHADSHVGVITCGQYYPKLGQLKIALVDLGVGIPFRVRTFLGIPEIPASDALAWAFEPNKTTKDDGTFARGTGLKILKTFIQENHGKLEIYSDKGYVCIAEGEARFENCIHEFRGTLVQITLMCDEAIYTLPNEDDYDSNEFYF